MKNYLKKIVSFALLVVLLVNTSYAIETNVINERWGKPIFVYGSGLSTDEVNKSADILGIDNIDNVNVAMVNGQDEIKYLGTGTGDDSAMISSVLIQKKDDNSGVTVEIKSPDNITQISPDQYRNASITAGVSNCHIIVGSVKSVTGESALTGIYKAFEANGEVLEHERMVVAQEELEVTNDIAQENLKKENFDIGKLNNIIVDVKQEINNYYDSNEARADVKEIEQFILTSVEKYELESVITQDQIDRLTKLFEDYQKTGAVNSEEVKKELSILAEDIGAKAEQIYKDAKESGIFEKISDFFSRLLDSILNAINK